MPVIILNIIVFIFSLLVKVALHIAKISLLMLSVPADFTANKAMKELHKNRKRDDSSVLIQSGTLVSYIALKSLVTVLTVFVWVIDIILTLLTVFGIFIGLGIFIMLVAAITAGAYIIVLNNCSVGNSSNQSTSSTSSSNSSESTKRGDSATAGMGEFTQEAKDWAKTWEVTYIGDSLGVGGQSVFTSYFEKAEYHSDGSRGLSQLKGMTTGKSGIEVLEELTKEGKVKENLVVALGTNNDMTLDNMKSFYEKIPESVKTITWVLTASEGVVDNESINKTIKEFVEAHDNMRYLDFKTFVSKNGGWSSFASSDGIHMTPEGYKKYAEFQVQGLYDLYGDGSSSNENKKDTSSEQEDSKQNEKTRGLDFFGSAYRLADRTIKKANNMYVLAKEDEDSSNTSDEEVDSSESSNSNQNDSEESTSKEESDGSEESESDSSKKSNKGCNYSTTKVELGSNSSSSNSSSYSGDVGYLYKVPFTITQGWGATNFAATGAYAGFENGWHSGVDFAGPDKTEILSATDGEVFEVIDDLSIGYIIIIKVPNGFLTYEHLLEPGSTYVKKGDHVKVGQVLGKQAGSANGNVYAFGSHLHFQYNPGNTWTMQSLSHGSKSPAEYVKGLSKEEADNLTGNYYELNSKTITPE